MTNPISRLNVCWICKGWFLERLLKPVEIPDQGTSYILKLCCSKCLASIEEVHT